MTAPELASIEAMLARGEHAQARVAAGRLVGQPGVPQPVRAAALWLRARACEQGGAMRDAIIDMEALGALAPNNARVFAALGALLSQAGEPRRAAEALARSVQLDPQQAQVWFNLGSKLRAIGERDKALRAFGYATQVKPDYARAHAGRGVLLEEMGQLVDAEAALTRALELDATMVPALHSLGAIWRERRDVEAATALYERAAAVAPDNADAWMQLARARTDVDDLDGARVAFSHAARSDPGLLRAHLGRCLSLSNVYADTAAVQAERARYAEGLAELELSLPALAAPLSHERRLDSLRWTNFLLGYQGQDDRILQQRYGALLTHALAPATPLPARVAGRTRVRVGFVSAFFRNSTVGRYFASWVKGLDPLHFEVVVYHLYATTDALAQGVRACVDLFRECPRWMPAALEKVIRADAPDVLVYPELGMDATTFAVASLRLAPLQVAGWGHPVTTGLPSIDVFLSSDAMEPMDGDAHYSEELLLLPGLGTRYEMPLAPAGATREQFNLPAGRPLLLCPQSPFKVLPADDALFARVLAAVPDGALVVFQGRNTVVTRRYVQRLNSALAAEGVDAEGRIVVLPVLGHADYLRVNTLCDVMLDPTGWSGGNTALDAVASGLPIVTLPGRFMRSRQTAGMYALMGVQGLTADSEDVYIATVARLLADRAFRAAMAADVVARRSALFDDPAPLRALNQLLRERSAAH